MILVLQDMDEGEFLSWLDGLDSSEDVAETGKPRRSGAS